MFDIRTISIICYALMAALPTVNCYSEGPPIGNDICTSMTPGHTNGSNPFRPRPNVNATLDINGTAKCYKAGGPSIDMSLNSFKVNNMRVDFEGIFVQAKLSTNLGQNFGMFSLKNATNLKISNCFGNNMSALHHSAPLGAHGISFTWTPPSSNVGDLTLMFTVVEEFEEFWVNLPYEMPVCSSCTSYFIIIGGRSSLLLHVSYFLALCLFVLNFVSGAY